LIYLFIETLIDWLIDS